MEIETTDKIVEKYLNNTFKSTSKEYNDLISKKYVALADHEKEKDKWLEERGRMAKLLFKKGIHKW